MSFVSFYFFFPLWISSLPLKSTATGKINDTLHLILPVFKDDLPKYYILEVTVGSYFE